MTAWEFIGQLMTLCWENSLALLKLESPFGFTYWQLAVGCFVISLSLGILSSLLRVAGGATMLRARAAKKELARRDAVQRRLKINNFSFYHLDI